MIAYSLTKFVKGEFLVINLGKKVLSIMMIMMLLGFSSFSSNTSYAQESELDQKVMQSIEKTKELSEDLEPVEGSQSKVYIKKFKKLLDNGSISFHSDTINFEDIMVVQNKKNKEVILHIPLFFDEDQNELATVYIEKNGKLKSYMENHYSADQESHEVRVEVWSDNQKVMDDTVQLTAEYFETEQKTESKTIASSLNIFGVETASANSFTDFLKGFNNCLSAQGIAAWAIAAASIACSGLGPAGASACYYGLSFLTGGVVGYCWTSAKYYL